jgi:hypothetical protein
MRTYILNSADMKPARHHLPPIPLQALRRAGARAQPCRNCGICTPSVLMTCPHPRCAHCATHDEIVHGRCSLCQARHVEQQRQEAARVRHRQRVMPPWASRRADCGHWVSESQCYEDPRDAGKL